MGDCLASCCLLRREQGRDCPAHVPETPAATETHTPKINIQYGPKHYTTQRSLLVLVSSIMTLLLSVYKFTFITEVTILEGRLWPCAAAAMFAMVLRWFIWLIAMVTEAGGRLTGIRGCGIIMKGSSRPETHEEVVGYSMMHIMSEIFAGETLEALAENSKPAAANSAISNSHH